MTTPPSTPVKLSLHYRPTCIFCIRVLQRITQFKLQIETINVSEDRKGFSELVSQGGKQQVPALKITNTNGKVTWMYESRDILNYLESLQP